MEGELLLYIQELRNEVLDPIMVFITHTGDYGVLCIAAAFLLILLRKTRNLGHIIAFSIGIEFIINNGIIKNLVARIRPYEVIDDLTILIGKQPDYSFPSGHTGVTFAFAAAMFFALIFGIEGFPKSKRFVTATLLVCASSRILQTLCRSSLSYGRIKRNGFGIHNRSARICC